MEEEKREKNKASVTMWQKFVLALNSMGPDEETGRLGDFTTTPRMILISMLAIGIGVGPLFPVPPHPIFIGIQGLLGCLIVGLLAGALSALLTFAVYASCSS